MLITCRSDAPERATWDPWLLEAVHDATDEALDTAVFVVRHRAKMMTVGAEEQRRLAESNRQERAKRKRPKRKRSRRTFRRATRRERSKRGAPASRGKSSLEKQVIDTF